VKMSDNTKKQTQVLTDYMANLYMKFVAENPTVSSFANDSGLADTSIPSFLYKDFKISAMFWCLVHKHVLLLIKLVVRI
jgi:hypothetical protein